MKRTRQQEQNTKNQDPKTKETPRSTDLNRRSFLLHSAYGLGATALAGLLNPALFAAVRNHEAGSDRWRGVLNPPHYPIKARRVIHLCMAGGPSHLETFDWKPQLKALDGKPF